VTTPIKMMRDAARVSHPLSIPGGAHRGQRHKGPVLARMSSRLIRLDEDDEGNHACLVIQHLSLYLCLYTYGAFVVRVSRTCTSTTHRKVSVSQMEDDPQGRAAVLG
jgi:hypothetical protein